MFKSYIWAIGCLLMASSAQAIEQNSAPVAEPQAASLGNTAPGARKIDAGQATTVSVAPYEHTVLVQWRQLRPGKITRTRHHRLVRSAATVINKSQVLSLPENVVIKEARVIDAKDKYLLLCGTDKVTGFSWLHSYKLSEQWIENNAILANIPPFLFKNMQGNISFSGNDLVLTIANGVDSNASYKLVLHLIDDKYQLEGKLTAESPYNTVFQFVQNVRQAKTDLAKSWLIDPSLVSIPKYVGLCGTLSTKPSRIVSVSGAPAGIYRFRLVTFSDDDLVFDVVKTKAQWAIKSIFIAPSDMLWQRIARNYPNDSEPSGEPIAMPDKSKSENKIRLPE